MKKQKLSFYYWEANDKTQTDNTRGLRTHPVIGTVDLRWLPLTKQE